MTKEFKKGQAVIHFHTYDGKGTWRFTRAIVVSCGAKKMTLKNAETSAMMGCNFRPDSSRTYTTIWKGQEFVQNYGHFTLADMTDDEAHAVCIEAAKIELVDKNAHYDKCLAGGHGAGYDAAINKERAELHEPRSMKR